MLVVRLVSGLLVLASLALLYVGNPTSIPTDVVRAVGFVSFLVLLSLMLFKPRRKKRHMVESRRVSDLQDIPPYIGNLRVSGNSVFTHRPSDSRRPRRSSSSRRRSSSGDGGGWFGGGDSCGDGGGGSDGGCGG